jgi:hypothetical protein
LPSPARRELPHKRGFFSMQFATLPTQRQRCNQRNTINRSSAMNHTALRFVRALVRFSHDRAGYQPSV